jgi:hypothetical protein
MRPFRIVPRLAASFFPAGANLRADQAPPAWPVDPSNDRRALLEPVLAFPKANPAIPCKLGGVDVTGMDFSGAIFYLPEHSGREPPRSARDQYLWLRKLGRLSEVSAAERTAEDPAYAAMRPGDLVFCAHSAPDVPAEIHGSRVHLYPGKEADGRAIMIGSSEGRSYRHHKINGFGITDCPASTARSSTLIVATARRHP